MTSDPQHLTIPPGAILSDLCDLRLLERSECGFAFWHQSFRDYFAAVWLERRFRLWRIALFAWSVRWHEVLLFLVGLLDDARAARMLRHLFLLAKPPRTADRFYPSWRPNRLFLLLRCLVNTAGNQEALKDRFIDSLAAVPQGKLYLGRATTAVHSPYLGGGEEIYGQFYTLVGELRTPKSFEFLRRSVDQRFRVLGLSRSGQVGRMAALFDEFRRAEDGDSLGDRLTAVMLLAFQPDVLLGEIQAFLVTAEQRARRRLLAALVHAVPAFRTSGPDSPALPNDDEWVDFFTEVFLHDDDPDICRDARMLLNRMEGDVLSLPKRSESTFLATLEGCEPDIRLKIVDALLHSRTTQSLEAVIRAVHDEDFGVRLTALHVLELRDTENFPGHVARAIEAELLRQPSFRSEVEALLGAPLAAIAESGAADSSALDLAPLLILGAFATRAGLRRLSISALMRLDPAVAVPVLEYAFRWDAAAVVRTKALFALRCVLGDGAEPYLVEAFGDPVAAVRERAAHEAWYVSPELLARLAPRLEALLDDPDEPVRREARAALYHLERLSANQEPG